MFHRKPPRVTTRLLLESSLYLYLISLFFSEFTAIANQVIQESQVIDQWSDIESEQKPESSEVMITG